MNSLKELKQEKKYLLNTKQEGEAVEMLKQLDDKSVSLAFFDPQYEDVSDVSRAQISKYPLNNQTEYQIIHILQELERVIAPQGFILLWVNKRYLGNDHIPLWLTKTRKLALVDFLVWDKGSFGFGSYFRSQCEYAFLIQKKPISSKKFKRSDLANIWKEKIIAYKEKVHPHQKPFYLIKTLIEAMTKKGDLVIDPCAGSFAVLDACQDLGRNFIGVDLTLKDIKEFEAERERERETKAKEWKQWEFWI